MALNPVDGHLIAGVEIDDHRFIGRVKATQLFQLAPDPRDTENRRKVEANKELQELREIREEVQRLFVGAKAKNVDPYAEYICQVHHGQDGLTPTIVLYSEQPLGVETKDEGWGFIQVPWDLRLVAIDGETQLAARFEAANRDPVTKQEFVPVYICHGRDQQWARQAFHDLNVLAVRPNAALSLGMDARDPLTHVSREIERHVPFFTGRVDKVRRQLGKFDTDLLTITTLRGACVTLAEGIGGVKYGARPVSIDEARIPQITKVAIEWFEAVAKTIGPAIENRLQTVASSPAVFAAIGAMGHSLVNMDAAAERGAEQSRLLDRLRAVNWTRDKAWEGIAGNILLREYFPSREERKPPMRSTVPSWTPLLKAMSAFEGREL